MANILPNRASTSVQLYLKPKILELKNNNFRWIFGCCCLSFNLDSILGLSVSLDHSAQVLQFSLFLKLIFVFLAETFWANLGWEQHLSASHSNKHSSSISCHRFWMDSTKIFSQSNHQSPSTCSETSRRRSCNKGVIIISWKTRSWRSWLGGATKEEQVRWDFLN